MTTLPSSFDGRRQNLPASGISYYTRQIPINVTTCNAGGSVIFELPGNLPSTYLNTNASFLRVKLNTSNPDNSANELAKLGPAGFAGTIRNIHVSQQGHVLSEIQDYGKYRAIQQGLNCDYSYIDGLGRALNGTSSYQDGEASTNGFDDRVFIEPLAHHGGLFGCGRMIPLKGASIHYKVEFGDANYGIEFTTETGYSNSNVEFSEIELVLCMVQLSDSAEAMLSKQGGWSVLTKGVGTYVNSVRDGVSMHTINLGASYSQLLNVNWVFTDPSANPTLAHQNTDFDDNNLRKWSFSIDGVTVDNQKGILADCPAEIAAFNAIANGKLTSLTACPVLQSGSAIANSKGLSTVFTQSLEIYKGACGNFGDQWENMKLACSGRSTLSSTTNVHLEFGNSGADGDRIFTLFATYAQQISYDPVSNLFRVAN